MRILYLQSTPTYIFNNRQSGQNSFCMQNSLKDTLKPSKRCKTLYFFYKYNMSVGRKHRYSLYGTYYLSFQSLLQEMKEASWESKADASRKFSEFTLRENKK